MFKKILKYAGIILAVLFGLLLLLPFAFQNQIKEKIKDAINQKVNAHVKFEDASLSFIKNFPNATVQLKQLAIINKAPFEGDTLLYVEKLNLNMALTELFNNKSEAIKIDGFSTANGFVNVIVNENGIANYDIALKTHAPTTETEKSEPLNLKIENYAIENYSIRYFDQKSKLKMLIKELNHQGKGDFKAAQLNLDTQTAAKVSFEMNHVNYMNNMALSLEAILDIDLNQNKYTFRENKAKINELPLEFNGFVQMLSDAQVYDLKFKTPSSSFENFLGLIPTAYAATLDGVKTTGDFTVEGFAKGSLTKTTIPQFSVAIQSKNGSFQYPNLPKSVKNIILDTKIINQTGLMADTFVNLDQLSFQIDQDVFWAKAQIKNLNTNPLVDAAIKGTINLSNFSKAYPIKLDQPLTGILHADVTTKFDMQSVTNNDYQNIYNAGTLQLTGFNYNNAGKNMAIQNAQLQFNPSHIKLIDFKATTGKSDMTISGVLENFYGFIFKKQELKGNFNLFSNVLAVSDFMETATTTPSASNSDKSTPTNTKTPNGKSTKIPSFLNCTISAKANTILYDNLTLKNASGTMTIADQKVTLQHIKTNIFGGAIAFDGSVSTKGKTPVFDMNLGLDKVDIYQTFTSLDMLKKIAPLAGVINGKFTSNIKIDGLLDAQSMTPNLNTLTGDLLGQLSSAVVNTKNATLLNSLSSNIKFFDVNKINLNEIKALINFSNGKVNIKPFDIKYQDIKATVGGTHGFDQSMNYTIKFDVPAKYLGNEAQAILSKLGSNDVAKLQNIPINASISGHFSNPKITTDIKAASTALATQIAKQQKDKLVSKGTSALNDLLNKGKKDTVNKSKTDAQKADIINKAGGLINGIFKKK
ncbi:AsmA-like C-terminal region-containing protein [Flavobacterium branchiophilum]|uniref:AsmA family protein n=1 Tax=Flavobacterium branchiophilum TaxID=55197 RepID=A0A2H3KIK2_9FLAO|nr:AsmA-like C-terminal region-containing protein [Flavobacterium branchiophilum]PDS24437.1 AsmA family protein [Flavobacterium branchiophilum]